MSKLYEGDEPPKGAPKLHHATAVAATAVTASYVVDGVEGPDPCTGCFPPPRDPPPPGVWLFSHAACERHSIDGHPEQPARVRNILDALLAPGAGVVLAHHETAAPEATRTQLARFHTDEHLDKLDRLFA